VISEMEAKGIRPGPESFQFWNDGDAGLVRAIWCLTRHLKPKKVVETGAPTASRRVAFLRRWTGTEMVISGVLTFRHLKGSGAPRSARQLMTAIPIDGRTSRGQAGGAFPNCFLGLARSIYSFTTVSTVSATCASSLI
jgi:hypothetical protein